MNQNQLILFLEKFEIEKTQIRKYIQNKKILKINNNFFLTNNFQEKNQVFENSLIFIQLKKLLSSKYLLKFIKNNSKNIIEISSEKQALNFTYNKNLQIEFIKNSKNFKFNLNKNYLVLFENQILGYASFQKENKKLFFKNEMNIGEYLKEK